MWVSKTLLFIASKKYSSTQMDYCNRQVTMLLFTLPSSILVLTTILFPFLLYALFIQEMMKWLCVDLQKCCLKGRWAKFADINAQNRLARIWPQLLSQNCVLRIHDVVVQCVTDMNSKRDALFNLFMSDRKSKASLPSDQPLVHLEFASFYHPATETMPSKLLQPLLSRFQSGIGEWDGDCGFENSSQRLWSVKKILTSFWEINEWRSVREELAQCTLLQ